jgi:hypothetical protein
MSEKRTLGKLQGRAALTLFMGYLKVDSEACTQTYCAERLLNVDRILRYCNRPEKEDEDEILNLVSANKLLLIMTRLMIGFLLGIKGELDERLYSLIKDASVVFEALISTLEEV